MNTSELIEKAKSTLPNYQEVMDGINKRRSEFGNDFDEHLNWQLRRELKKLSLNPPTEENVLLFGVEKKDWGQVMRNKYKTDVYPETDKRAGQPIPEHDIEYEYYIYNGKDVLVMTSREDYCENIGKIIKVQYRLQGKKIPLVGMKPVRDAKEDELKIRGVPVINLKAYNSNTTVVSVRNDYRERPLVQMTKVNVIELMGSEFRLTMTADDASVEENEYLGMTIYGIREILNFNEDARDLTVWGFISKDIETNKIVMNAIGFHVKDDKYKAVKTKVIDKKDDVESFLN